MTTTIEVSKETWRQLNMRKNPGESFDDVVQDLMTEENREFENDEIAPKYIRHYEASGEQECANHTPDRGPCTDDADYIVVLENNNGEKEIPFCEAHANVLEGDA